MKQSYSQLILFSLSGLLLIAITNILVERYLFSWTGFLSNKIGLCDYKTVRVLAENGGYQKMSFDFDNQYIASEMRKKTDYQVEELDSDYLIVLKKIGNVSYEVWFANADGFDEGFKLKTSVEEKQFPESTGGESYITPNRVLKRKISTIIDDLPLIEDQKNEMKEYIRVSYCSGGKLW